MNSIMNPKENGRALRNPVPTVDIIIEISAIDGKQGIILIRRKNPPFGWALPGGFVDYGESLEQAAVREAGEETSLEIELKYQLHTYSDPARDPRQHTISTVFVAAAAGIPKAQDDAAEIGIFGRAEIDFPLAFDHRKILDDYFARRDSGNETAPASGEHGESDMNDEDTKDKRSEANVDFKELVRVWGPVEAEIIKNLLESEGIPCFFKGLMLQTIYPFSTDGLGEIKISVPERDFERARELLKNMEQKPPFCDETPDDQS